MRHSRIAAARRWSRRRRARWGGARRWPAPPWRAAAPSSAGRRAAAPCCAGSPSRRCCSPTARAGCLSLLPEWRAVETLRVSDCISDVRRSSMIVVRISRTTTYRMYLLLNITKLLHSATRFKTFVMQHQRQTKVIHSNGNEIEINPIMQAHDRASISMSMGTTLTVERSKEHTQHLTNLHPSNLRIWNLINCLFWSKLIIYLKQTFKLRYYKRDFSITDINNHVFFV